MFLDYNYRMLSKIQLLTGVKGNSISVGPARKLLSKALRTGPTDQMLPSNPVNNCIMVMSNIIYTVQLLHIKFTDVV